MDTPHTTENKAPENTPKPAGVPHHEKNTAMAILAYIGPLVIVSYLTEKSDPFVKFHIKQGLVLLVIEVIIWIIAGTFWRFYMLYNLIHLGLIILSIVGILNVTKHKEEKLPLVGDFAKHFTF